MGYKQYCKEPEKIENYEKAKKDNFKGWHCHHRLQTWTSDGERRPVDILASELKALGMYYNRPPEELIFLTSREHHSLHDEGENNPMYGKSPWNKGKKMSEEFCRKNAESHKGKHHSEETRRRIGAASKGNKYALGNTNVRGTHWFNNGKINIRAKECPKGFVPGRIKKP